MKLTSQPENKQFVKENTGSHWYAVDPASGQVTPAYDATLREARKQNLFPSPTTIEKDIRANPTLARWIKNEVTKAFVANPRNPGESDDAYAARCLEISDTVSRIAAGKGVGIHDIIENDGKTDNPIFVPYYEAYLPWHLENVADTLGKEVSLADARIGVAGRVDRIIMHPKHGVVILDYKTQNVRKTAAFYDSFPRQLSFYAQAYAHSNRTSLPRIMSVVIDSNNPSRPVEKLYTPEEQDASYREFLCHAWLWCNERDFWPAGKWTPIFPV